MTKKLKPLICPNCGNEILRTNEFRYFNTCITDGMKNGYGVNLDKPVYWCLNPKCKSCILMTSSGKILYYYVTGKSNKHEGFILSMKLL